VLFGTKHEALQIVVYTWEEVKSVLDEDNK